MCCCCLSAVLQVAYDQLSPLHAARNAPSGVSQFMPPVLLLHGTTDKSVPVASSLLLNDALQAAGVDTEVRLAHRHIGAMRLAFVSAAICTGGLGLQVQPACLLIMDLLHTIGDWADCEMHLARGFW